MLSICESFVSSAFSRASTASGTVGASIKASIVAMRVLRSSTSVKFGISGAGKFSRTARRWARDSTSVPLEVAFCDGISSAFCRKRKPNRAMSAPKMADRREPKAPLFLGSDLSGVSFLGEGLAAEGDAAFEVAVLVFAVEDLLLCDEAAVAPGFGAGLAFGSLLVVEGLVLAALALAAFVFAVLLALVGLDFAVISFASRSMVTILLAARTRARGDLVWGLF